jgi:hypothetical protein
MTRGERNFNPGNIRRVAGVVWEGENPDQSSDDAFVVFISVEYGIRAMARILLSYAREGLNTVATIIDRWAPPNENNSAIYVKDVCATCGVGPGKHIYVPYFMPWLIRGIIQHENDEVIYTDQQIAEGIALANT